MVGKDESKFSTLECDVLELNYFNFWNQHSRISLEINFQENQKTLRVLRFFAKIAFVDKKTFFDKNFRETKPILESHEKMQSNDTSHDTSARL